MIFVSKNESPSEGNSLAAGLTVLLGAIAGLTILLGLPIARVGGLSSQTKGFLNAVATGVLVFLLWDVLTGASGPVEAALQQARHGHAGRFQLLAGAFALGLCVGLLSLVAANAALRRRTAGFSAGPGAMAVTEALPVTNAGRRLAMMIAIGLGLHNFSEGLAIGQSAARGAIAFALTLIIGFGLHNITEGFGVAAPLAADADKPTWGFLIGLGLIAGGPTFLGTVAGYSYTSDVVDVLFLTLAAGAILYVLSEMFAVGRRMLTPRVMAIGLLVGFLAGYLTDLLLTYAGA
ncbi:MAG: zinc permease [Actinobacteria bacterium]|nr:MAG: zinc permease [Actinomycetota bacterium]